MKILIIGPLPQKNDEKTIGGATILFAVLISFFNEKKIPHKLIETNKKSKGGKLITYSRLFFSTIKAARGCDAIFCNLSKNGTATLLPVLWIIAKVLKKKIVFRAFGSWLDSFVEENSFKRIIYSHIFKDVDLLVVETQALSQKMKKLNPSTFTLPNCRSQPTVRRNLDIPYRKRLVYVSQLKKEKGIIELLDAFERLKDYSLEVYGPISDSDLLFVNGLDVYKGVLTTADEVKHVLMNSDVLVLPTYYEGEGHPGIIIEALSVGIPIISTNFKSIPEIITDGVEGYLSEVKSSESLYRAIKKIRHDNYAELSRNAIRKFSTFDSQKVHLNLLQKINSIK